ncbi:SNF2-related domain-containing protein [Tieghemostelium lacteum]|uniref:SNF2-related domain-containing protein n=1 Tax=Tieghemostelium lacteum TaxID=361077 RepID=A0A152A2G5_TIELA|nr:SNF2-related domain-containing protein [Tieghemostelium lacteum]|eukprot:KYR00261.1 SNF2-related domain-containing protein [Tieghemostelium lacteum]
MENNNNNTKLNKIVNKNNKGIFKIEKIQSKIQFLADNQEENVKNQQKIEKLQSRLLKIQQKQNSNIDSSAQELNKLASLSIQDVQPVVISSNSQERTPTTTNSGDSLNSRKQLRALKKEQRKQGDSDSEYLEKKQLREQRKQERLERKQLKKEQINSSVVDSIDSQKDQEKVYRNQLKEQRKKERFERKQLKNDLKTKDANVLSHDDKLKLERKQLKEQRKLVKLEKRQLKTQPNNNDSDIQQLPTLQLPEKLTSTSPSNEILISTNDFISQLSQQKVEETESTSQSQQVDEVKKDLKKQKKLERKQLREQKKQERLERKEKPIASNTNDDSKPEQKEEEKLDRKQIREQKRQEKLDKKQASGNHSERKANINGIVNNFVHQNGQVSIEVLKQHTQSLLNSDFQDDKFQKVINCKRFTIKEDNTIQFSKSKPSAAKH